MIFFRGLPWCVRLDFDVHHGNGTQEVFYDTDEILFILVHQHDIFPFTVRAGETGRKKGKGYTINLPVFSQLGDGEYTYLLGHILQNLVEQYLPQIILVSAGYDGDGYKRKRAEKYF